MREDVTDPIEDQEESEESMGADASMLSVFAGQDDEDVVVVEDAPGAPTEGEPGVVQQAEDPETEAPLVTHRLVGKHSLRVDPFFGGKREKKEEDEEHYTMDFDQLSKFSIDPGSEEHDESNDAQEMYRRKMLKELVYNGILHQTDIDMKAPRRKPSKVDFNMYFNAVKSTMEKGMFSDAEVFVELSVYFSDNLFNMFKLLDTEVANGIIEDLRRKYGVMNRLSGLDFQ